MGKIEELYETKNGRELLLLEEQSKTPTAQISRIVDEAYKYFINSPYLDTCPVCGQEIKFNEVCVHLENLKFSLSNILKLENELTEISQEINESNNLLRDSTEEILELYKELFGEEIKEPRSGTDLLEFLKTKEIQINSEKEKLGKIVPMYKKIGIYQSQKKNLTKLKTSLKEIEDELKIKKKIYEDIEKFYIIYIAKYSAKIKEELEVISKNEVTRIYNAINQSSNEVVENFIVEPNLESKEIAFLAEIKGTSQKVSAIEFLSTGHLRCLGFALLIARIKAKTDNLKFIVIDDPVYSIDHEHRYNLIHYLNELGDKYQLIITSSDRLFSDILRNSFNDNNFVSYETSLSIESGIATVNVKLKSNQYIDEAKKHLQAKDFRASSLYARLSLETKLFDVAEKLNIKIPFKKIHKISMKDLVELGIIRELKEKYPEKASEIGVEFNKLSDHRYFKSLLKGFPLDEEVHHPHDNRSFYSKKEIEDVISSIEAFNIFITSLAQ